MTARHAVGLVAALLALATSPPAAAEDVSRSELRSLASAAAGGDAHALAELRRVTTVDGAGVDLARTLRNARGRELDQRLRTLARSGSGTPMGTFAARRTAAEILSARRFRDPGSPRPLRGVLERLSDGVRAIGEAIGRALEPITGRLPGGALPGGGGTLWGLMALAVLATAALGARRLVVARVKASAGRAAAREPRIDPARLEREADEAERRGDLESALRLRFRAGLVRLQRADIVRRGDSLTTAEVAGRLGSPVFDQVAAAFDEVVYGRRPAGRSDVEVSRTGWARVLGEVGA